MFRLWSDSQRDQSFECGGCRKSEVQSMRLFVVCVHRVVRRLCTCAGARGCDKEGDENSCLIEKQRKMTEESIRGGWTRLSLMLRCKPPRSKPASSKTETRELPCSLLTRRARIQRFCVTWAYLGGTQGQGWGCGYRNTEQRAVFLNTPINTLPQMAGDEKYTECDHCLRLF